MQQGQSKHNGSGKMGSGAERDSKGKGRRQHDRTALAAHAVPSAGLPLGSGVAPAGRGGRGGRGGIRAGGRVQVYSKTQGVWCDGRCAYTDHSRVEMPEIADLGMIACVPSGFCGWSIPSPPKVRPIPAALSAPALAQLSLVLLLLAVAYTVSEGRGQRGKERTKLLRLDSPNLRAQP